MKTFLLLLCCSCLACCNLKKTFAEVQSINSDLVTFFNNDNIDTSIGWGPAPKDNKMTVTFSRFDVDNSSRSELDSIGLLVRQRIVEHHPDMKKLDHITVRFSKQAKKDNIQDYVIFDYKTK